MQLPAAKSSKGSTPLEKEGVPPELGCSYQVAELVEDFHVELVVVSRGEVVGAELLEHLLGVAQCLLQVRLVLSRRNRRRSRFTELSTCRRLDPQHTEKTHHGTLHVEGLLLDLLGCCIKKADLGRPKIAGKESREKGEKKAIVKAAGLGTYIKTS